MTPRIYTLRAFKLGLVAGHLLPRAWSQALAPWLARWCAGWTRAARAALRENLAVIEPGASADEIERRCQRTVENFARMLADYFRCAGRARIHDVLSESLGLGHLDAALERGRGVILTTGHLGHWELGGLLLANRGLPMTIVTLDEPTPGLTLWRDAFRRQAGIRTVTVGPGHRFAFVEMMQALRRNEIVAMLVDRPYAGSGVDVNFFERRTQFSTGPALLWQHTGAAVVPAFVLLDEGGGYTARADAGLPFCEAGGPAASAAQNTQLLASHFENIIRQHSDQWFQFAPLWPRKPGED
jgi:KDO2-lipid IV(A) lauroyltransferase